MANPRTTLSRRGLLLGAAGLVVAVGCGRSGGGDDDPDAAAGDLSLAEYYDRNQVAAGREVRLPLGLVGADGVTLTDVPDRIEVAVAPYGAEPGPATTVDRHDEGVPRPYFPARVTLPAAGSWDLVVRTGGATIRSTLSAVDATPVPGPGDEMPALRTPTTADGRGVDPICTAAPMCPLHAESVDEVLAAGRPLALLVSTPRFCDIGVCGPVLDLLVAASAAHPTVGFVHAEVYTDLDGVTPTPTVTGLGLTFEPALFLVGADGVVADRLDVLYDARELDAVLGDLV